MLMIGVVAFFVPGLGCVPKPMPNVQPAIQTSFADMSDEFDNPQSLSKWSRANKVEGWNVDQLERFDIGKTQMGWMTMMPYASTWYQDYRGVLAFKLLTGDFIVTTHLKVSRRQGTGAPQSQFSLAGIMARAPRTDSASSWRRGQENYVFLSLGSADRPGQFQFEVKSTTNSDSQLVTEPASTGDAIIRVARIGATMVMLKNVEGKWSVHRRYSRPDLPPTLQVGLTCYTDWPTASQMPPDQHNGSVIRTGRPDLLAMFDYVRFTKPSVPKGLTDANSASDQELLSFLGGS